MTATISQRNRFFKGDEIEIVQPGKPFIKQIVTEMENDKGEKIEVAPHAAMTVKIKVEKRVVKDAILRKMRG